MLCIGRIEWDLCIYEIDSFSRDDDIYFIKKGSDDEHLQIYKFKSSFLEGLLQSILTPFEPARNCSWSNVDIIRAKKIYIFHKICFTCSFPISHRKCLFNKSSSCRKLPIFDLENNIHEAMMEKFKFDWTKMSWCSYKIEFLERFFWRICLRLKIEIENFGIF